MKRGCERCELLIAVSGDGRNAAEWCSTNEVAMSGMRFGCRAREYDVEEDLCDTRVVRMEKVEKGDRCRGRQRLVVHCGCESTHA